MYVMIPSSVFYFIAGIVSSFVFIIILGVILANKQKKKTQKDIDNLINYFANKINKKDDE